MILADEPTGALDTATSLEVMALLQRLNREGITIVLVTHEPDMAAHASRTITFRDGRVVSDRRQPPHPAGTHDLTERPPARASADVHAAWQRPAP